MSKVPLITTLVAVSLLIAANTEGTLQIGALVVLAGVLGITLWAIIPPRPNKVGCGRYLATVYADAYGDPARLWSRRYRSRLFAKVAAYRAALRMDFLGDVYSDFQVRWEVQDLARSHGPAAAVPSK